MNKSWIDKNLIAVPIEEVSTPKTGRVARVGAFRKGHTITAEHRALMEAGKAERKARRLSHSAAKRITFRKNARLIDLNKTPGTPYFFTLKPLCDIEPEYFNEAMTGLIKRLRTASAEYIYALEWAEHERMPHIHLVANIPGNTPAEVEAFAEGVIRYWLKKTPKNPNTRIKQDARPVYDAHGLFNYMSKQPPDEFNARAIATGKDWSVISVTGCSRGWVESRFDTAEVSRETGSAIQVSLEWDADGEPNFNTLLRNGKWFAKVQLNGELSAHQQEAFLNTFSTKHERTPNA